MEPAIPAHCPDGFALGVDPANPGLCAQKTSDGSDAYYLYADMIPAVDPVMGCPNGYALGIDPAHLGLCAQVSGSHEVLVTPAHCPDGFALGVDPAHPDDCAKRTNGDPVQYTFTADRLICPTADSAYTSTNSSLPCKRKISNNWRYAAKVTDSFTVTFVYAKWDQDPCKCHIPTGESLGVPSWAMSDFNNDYPQFKLNTEAACSPTYAYADMIPPEYKTVIDYTYADLVVIEPGVPAHCPDGYAQGADTSKPDACAKLVEAVPPTYSYADMISEIPAVWGCPEGSTKTNEGCQQPGSTEDLYARYLLNLPVEPGSEPTPVCDPHSGCTGSAPIWENIYGSIGTGSQLYGNGHQSMDVTWTAADICVWNKAEQKCASTLPIVTIKVRAPQPAFTIVFNGQVLTPETVNAADGAVWYVFRAQITDASVMKLYSGITVLSKGEFFIMDQGNTKHWWEVANVIPWIYSSCSDAPDFGDTRLTGGVAEMGRFPGMNTSDVEHFLTLNGVPSADAHTWAIDTWFKLQFGEYAALPASFTAVQPPAR